MYRKFTNIFLRFTFRKVYHHRQFTSLHKNVVVENLPQRALMKVYGPDATSYLQGLVTNDVQNFKSDNNADSSIFTLFLNNHGRILYDCLMYKLSENEYLVEYDSDIIEHMTKHLTKYKLRKEIKIELMDDLKVWVAYIPHEKLKTVDISELSNLIENIKGNDDIFLTSCDPRITSLGYRVLCKNVDLKSMLKYPEQSIQESYSLFRYRLGVGEGIIDHPPGSCLPFEVNADFLNGVNFQKGCYIGQELTAKVHFTGVIRKRVMPIVLSSNQKITKLPVDCGIFNLKGKKIGKLRSNIGEYGIATLNVEESFKTSNLKIKDFDIEISAIRPEWWPTDAYRIKG